MDERIRPMAKAPWWLILHLFILPTRSVKSGRKYGKIWTEAGSPFDVEHAKLRNLLEQRLQGDGMDVRVQVGQSYGEDSILGGPCHPSQARMHAGGGAAPVSAKRPFDPR